MTTPCILLLNGPSSSGKSTLARSLQERAKAPFLHLAIDTFLEMQPPRHDNHPDTFFWTTTQDEGYPRTAFRTGAMGAALMRGFRQTPAVLALEGWNVIVDDVAEAADWTDYQRRLEGFRFITVKVHAPLPVLEQRERDRGDRMPGLARDQWQRVHDGIAYDFDIDTSRLSANAAAELICSQFGI